MTQPCSTWSPIWCDVPAEAVAATGTSLAVASEILWALSGRQFGLCPVTVRPCRRDCFGGFWPYDSWQQWTGAQWPRPVLFDGVWFNVACGSCPGTCSCTRLEEVLLPAPVDSITEIKVDGAALAASGYALYNGMNLLRVDGSTWPACNDLNKADTEVGTWSITFQHGVDVPVSGRRAVGELARELALLCVGSNACQLPQPVQSVSRQGVDITYVDPAELLTNGKTGLYLTDMFIETYNPKNLRRRAAVFDVDGPRPWIPGG